jgi:hypothetical protein
MRFYKVSVRDSADRNKLRWWEARSKNYASLTHALAKMDEYKRMGMEPVLFRSPEFEWEQVELDSTQPL